jgi:glucose/arabinose dehydrogenase
MARHRRWLLALLALLIVALVIAGTALFLLDRRGYLPKPVTLTAEVAPMEVPLPSPRPTQIASPTPVVVISPSATSALSVLEPTVTATVLPTRVVPPAEAISFPEGFGISVFAAGLAQPRMMALGPDDQLYVAEREANRIVRLPDHDGDGIADGVEVIADNLDAPSSLIFYRDGTLYVGETTRVLRLSAPDASGVFQQRDVIIQGLPDGGHSTRTVLFNPDWTTLFVSVGSSCNVCLERDERRATVMRYAPDGSDGRIFASGLRNAVGITFRPGTDELWATNNGRDWLGDDQPPETIYLVREGDDAGWPRCHSGRIIDPDFGSAGACEGVLAPLAEMQAHSAPLGLTFYNGEQFPEHYRGGMFVAFHGSWNRSNPTGYKVVWAPVDDGVPGVLEDFAAGWLRPNGTNWGRPVDVLTASDSALFVSDDGAGIVYRIFYAETR